MLLVGTQEQALGQSQWTTNGNNINNTNTGNVGVGTSTPAGTLTVNASNIDYTNTGGAGAHVLLTNPSASGGQNVLASFINGTLQGKWRNDFAGNINYVSGAGGHYFFTGGDYPSGAVRMSILNNGNVGIGTNTPSYRLHITGNNTTAGGFPVIKLQNTQTGGHSYWLYSGALNNAGDFGLYDETDNVYRLYVKGSSGNVGIGTYAPRSALDVAGGESYATIGVSGSLGSGAILSGSTGSTFLSNNVYLNAAANQFKVVDPTKISAGLQLAGRDVYFRSFSAATTPLHTELLFINGTSGNVGIGTITPAYKLDMVGSLNASGGLCMAGDCKSSWSQVGGTSQWTTSGTTIYYNSGSVGIGTTTPLSKFDVWGGTYFGTVDGAQLSATDSSPVAQNVGGSISFVGKFNTAGNYAGFARISGVKENATSGHYGGALVFQVRANGGNQTEYMRINSVGNVGIGTTSPAAKLDVAGAVTLSTNTSFPGPTMTSALLYHAGTTGLTMYGAGSTHDFLLANKNGADVLAIPTGTTNAYFTGNVGIGTTTPSEMLDVVGNVNATGTITGGNIVAKYQDVAEWVPARQQMSAGTVVVLDTEQSNQVTTSKQSYDTRVAGVVSAQPGVILGEAGENKAMIATTGRVKVKVDATRSPIKLGDLLVTSDREGMAMKSEPLMIQGRPFHSPGTLIGKALEPLEKGTGEILVLLSLQ
jgi:hypothetical protein